MTRLLNILGARGPIVMSAAAILLLLVALATGWELHAKDEGVVAHTWQLLIGLQIPLIVLFFATADWREPAKIARILALQVALLVLAMAPVAMLRL